MIGFGLGKTVFDPSTIAYMGDRVPYHRRSLAIGVSEFSWGAALLIAAPLTGLLLERSTLSSVFLVLCGANLLGAILVLIFLPGDRPQGTEVRGMSLGSIWRAVRGNPAAMGAIGYAMCNSAANEMIFINYGAFMEQSFGLALSALGVVTIAIAAAEAFGEGAVAGAGDRLGPKRMALAGAVLAAACYAIFPLFGSSLPVAIGGIFIMFLGYEIAVVAAIPLYTELLPTARGSMMAAVIGGVSLGRLTGGLTGALVYNTAGVAVNSLVACGVLLIGMTLFWRAVHVHVERT
jgi:predicted MFS family arabinose efflux permease